MIQLLLFLVRTYCYYYYYYYFGCCTFYYDFCLTFLLMLVPVMELVQVPVLELMRVGYSLCFSYVVAFTIGVMLIPVDDEFYCVAFDV